MIDNEQQEIGQARVEKVIREMAQANLDSLWNTLKQAEAAADAALGTALHDLYYDHALKIFRAFETTKDAYRAIGITGHIGIHRI